MRRAVNIRWRPYTTFLLFLVWLLLWSEITWANVASGVVVSVVLPWLLPMPKMSESFILNPYRLFLLVVRFQIDLVLASVQVAYYALRRAPVPPSAVIGVKLRSSSDVVLTVVAQLISLVPGSLIVDVDKSTRTLYVHAFAVGTIDKVPQVHASIEAIETRVIRTFGSAADRSKL